MRRRTTRRTAVRVPGMRARITAVATLIAGAAVAITAAVILHAVETSLENDLHGDQVAAIERVGDALRSGAQPNELDLASIFAGAGTAGAIQVLDQTGRVVATTPGAESLAALDAGVVSGDGMIPSLPDGADQPTLLTPTGVSVAGARPTGTSGAPGTAGQPVGIDEVSEPFTTAEWLAAIRGDGSDVSVSQGRVYLGSGAFTVVAASPLAPVRESLAAVEGGLVIALPLLVLIVAISTWFLTGRALRPVEAIRSEVESISGTTLARRVPDPGTGDEIGRLAATMNQMLDRLESAAQRQQQFIADASHELRSPVATIRAYLEVARHTADTTDWSAVVDDVLTEEARLEATIADLLLSASLDEGAPIRDAEPVDLAALAHDLDRRPRPEQPALRIEVPEQAIVHVSRVQLDRAVSNLVDNALRHAASSVQITVISIGGDAGPDPRAGDAAATEADAPHAPSSAAPASDAGAAANRCPNPKAADSGERDHGSSARSIRVTVDDDGPGIDPQDRERVFERFTRLDGHRTRGTAGAPSGGTGLGLALVRQIAERHGGTVCIASAPTGGARFVLDIPVGPPGAPDAAEGHPSHG